MKKLFIAACITCALAFASNAAEGEKEKKASPGHEQAAIRKELKEKYDTDKNGRLSKDEKSKMTAEDLEKWNNAAPKKKAADASEPKAKKE